ncbi:hypothetical protein CspHIS471_0203980 [Cutaneotrichosporon sp. HIS471]|nr:hypothetical protein CspHIS471_0203980 [Cutaneotrichosporon sp. HIS471]
MNDRRNSIAPHPSRITVLFRRHVGLKRRVSHLSPTSKRIKNACIDGCVVFQYHYTETHDPIAREKLERGEKIFECFLPLDQCTKVCLTPKKRRHHLIDKHGYPNTYYFGITCHGLNRITREDGPAASLIRPYRVPENKDTVLSGHGHRATLATHHAPPHPPSEVDMEDLTARMGALESSLAFVPRNVRRAAARRETRGPMVG